MNLNWVPAVTLTQDLDGYILLEDGRFWRGRLAGTGSVAAGEVVFTTNLTGYQEVLTDPSFAGQIVVMTAPMIGNYGTTPVDEQATKPWVSSIKASSTPAAVAPPSELIATMSLSAVAPALNETV